MTDTNPSVREVCEFFWRIEEKYSLLDKHFAGWPAWQYARLTLYYDLLINLGVGDEPHPQGSATKTGYMQRLRDFFKTTLTRNPLIHFGRCDLVMLEHPRVQKSGDEWIDIYSHYMEQEWETKGINWRAVTAATHGSYPKPDSRQRFRRGALDFIAKVLARFRHRLSEEDLQQVAAIEQEVVDTFGKQWALRKQLQHHANAVRAATSLFSYLFRIWKPRELFVVVGYEVRHAGAILAAHRLGIKVTELQHGTINRYHLGYSYPHRRSPLPCFPDRLLVWSRPWADSVPFRQELASVEIRPFEWLKQRKARYQSVAKQKAVIVISQGLLGDRVAAAFLPHVERWHGHEIRYKLHPSEYARWREYPHLVTLMEQYGVKVLENCDLYQQFAECSDQVGVFSTALYEGMEFDCKTFVLDLPGVEYMDSLIDSGAVELLPSKSST